MVNTNQSTSGHSRQDAVLEEAPAFPVAPPGDGQQQLVDMVQGMVQQQLEGMQQQLQDVQQQLQRIERRQTIAEAKSTNAARGTSAAWTIVPDSNGDNPVTAGPANQRIPHLRGAVNIQTMDRQMLTRALLRYELQLSDHANAATAMQDDQRRLLAFLQGA